MPIQRLDPLRALIVEDDKSLRDLLAQLLRSRGFETRAVETVAMGLAEVRSGKPPHCLLLDLSLPDGDGTKILQHIRAHDMDSVVAIVTGSMDDARLKELTPLHPDTILRKPFGLREVLDWLDLAETREIARINNAVVSSAGFDTPRRKYK